MAQTSVFRQKIHARRAILTDTFGIVGKLELYVLPPEESAAISKVFKGSGATTINPELKDWKLPEFVLGPTTEAPEIRLPFKIALVDTNIAAGAFEIVLYSTQ
ncbi:hypothetical protein [Bacillus cereus]|uniref:hypothetical protein n=1 Tax=Bacillus cereus TaxID=1396 RepID=UPI001650F13F|nr:hypothetical protein [Bacillus cereus]